MSELQLVVFLGPTLPLQQARALLQADYRPPAAQGDVYRAARTRPLAIGLIDGVFHHEPSVWHKEILWALSQGVHVFGASSMGALRAAELHPFGMVGVGRVFEDFRDGRLDADDEVALVHGPAETGWLPLSEPLVDLRATLHAAQAAGVLDANEAAGLTGLAKGLHYPERNWSRLLPLAAEHGIAAARLQALQAWLPGGRVARKQADAIELLQLMQQRCTPALEPMQVDFAFEDSLFWAELQAAVDAEVAPLSADERRTLDALRADPEAAAAAEGQALAWMLAAQHAGTQGQGVEAAAMLAASRDFCARHGLQDEAAVDGWLRQHGLTEEDLHRLLAWHAPACALRDAHRERLDAVLLDVLRWRGTGPQRAGPNE